MYRAPQKKKNPVKQCLQNKGYKNKTQKINGIWGYSKMWEKQKRKENIKQPQKQNISQTFVMQI